MARRSRWKFTSQMPDNPRPHRKKASPPLPPPDSPEWVTVGRITAPFGLHGEVKCVPETDFPDRLAERETLYVGPARMPMRLESVRAHGTILLLHFVDIPDITAAETLRGMTVAVPPGEISPLGPDQYYLHDLVGLRAMHVDGTDLGTVVDIITGAAQDLLVVRRPGQPDVLVPFVKALVPQVDLAARTVTIDPPLGLFDDNWVRGE
jgi:16S rRNA processing protein RimM